MKYLTSEDIRHKNTDLSQVKFASEIGMPLRTYLDRVSGNYPDWKISELIALSKFNDGTVFVENDSKKYAITIQEIKGK